MNFLKIPVEEVVDETLEKDELQNLNPPFTKKAIKSKVKKGKIKAIRTKLWQKNFTKEQKILKETCLSLSDFLTSEGDFKLDDVKKLNQYLEKANIIVHKRKTKLLEKKKRKGKK